MKKDELIKRSTLNAFYFLFDILNDQPRESTEKYSQHKSHIKLISRAYKTLFIKKNFIAADFMIAVQSHSNKKNYPQSIFPIHLLP